MTDFAKTCMTNQITEYELDREQLEAVILDALHVTGTIYAGDIEFEKNEKGNVVAVKIRVEKRKS